MGIAAKCELSCGVCAADCVDNEDESYCAKKLSKGKCSTVVGECDLTCGVCGGVEAAPPPPPPPACEDKKGAEWCAKKTKSASKAKKTCGDAKKAKKCELTCCGCDLDECAELWD